MDSRGISGLAFALNSEANVTQPIYLLVHGAWGGAWCWDEVVKELNSRGAAWRTVNLPSSQIGFDPTSNLDDDAKVVADAANGIDGSVILVGHSYAGAVITQAAPLVDRLDSLFYIAATVPEIGQSHSDTARLVRVRTEMDSAIHLDGDILLIFSFLWGYSSAGRALAWHARGPGFESPYLHFFRPAIGSMNLTSTWTR
jgi:pimeloyl-ACP methyl ester carboxylesterase